MTPEELELVKSTLTSVSNVSAQGWDVLVHGTVTSNEIYLVCIVIDVLVGIFCAWLGARTSEDEDTKCDNAITGFIAGVVICGLVLLLASSYLVAIFAPDYVVLDRIISLAAR